MEDQQEGELRLLDDPIYRHFKMEGTAMLKYLVKRGDWMVKSDLQDAYLTVPVLPSHCPFLLFEWKGTVYEFSCLTFGLSLAPWGFNKILKSFVAFLRKYGINKIFYLDSEFLGLKDDSRDLSVSLPESKVKSIIDLCEGAINKNPISLYETARILGKFTWATSA